MLQRVREFLLGRKLKIALRFQDGLAERPGPEANLPEGPAHKVAFNYYYARDARREVTFPTMLADNTKDAAAKALPSGSDAQGTVAPTTTLSSSRQKTPGKLFNYSN